MQVATISVAPATRAGSAEAAVQAWAAAQRPLLERWRQEMVHVVG